MKKIIPVLGAALSLSVMLSACSPKAPTPTVTPEPTPSSTPEIVLPSETPSLDNDENLNDPNMGYLDVSEFLSGNTYESPLGFSVYLPESWVGKFTAQEKPGNEDATTIYFAQKDSGETLGYLLILNVADKNDVIAEFGEDYETFMSDGSMILGHSGDYVVYVTWPNADDFRSANSEIAKEYDEMLTHKDDLNWYIPEPVYIPAQVQPIADAITSAIGAELAEYNPVVADPQKTVYLDLFGLTVEDVSDFAVSASMMNVKAYAVAAFKPVDGKVDAVKTALETYKTNTMGNFEHYLPDQYDIASNAVIEVVGDYVVIAMCEDADSVMQNISNSIKDYHYVVDAVQPATQDVDEPTEDQNVDSGEDTPETIPDVLTAPVAATEPIVE